MRRRLISHVISLTSEIQKYGSVLTGPTTYLSSMPGASSPSSRLQSPGGHTGAGPGGEGHAGTEVVPDWPFLSCLSSACSPMVSIYFMNTNLTSTLRSLFAEGLSIWPSGLNPHVEDRIEESKTVTSHLSCTFNCIMDLPTRGRKGAQGESWELCFIQWTFWGLKPERQPLR